MHSASESLKAITLESPQTITATQNGSAVDLGPHRQAVMVTVQTGDITGASTTYDLKIQGSADGSTGWADITGAALTQMTENDDNKIACIDVKTEGASQRYIRLVSTLAGGTPSLTFSAVAHVLAERGGASLNSATAA